MLAISRGSDLYGGRCNYGRTASLVRAGCRAEQQRKLLWSCWVLSGDRCPCLVTDRANTNPGGWFCNGNFRYA